MSKQTRREFIKTGAGVAGAGLSLPVLNRNAFGTTIVKELAANQIGDGNVLVIVELGGGNDGLNTVVPLRQHGTYASLRTRIAIPQAQVLPLYGANTFNGQPTMGLAPYFQSLMPVVNAGKLAVIQSAHYPTPNLSHESSRSYYYSARPNANSALQGSGWIGRHSALFGNGDNALDTIGIGGVNKTLYASGAKFAGINAGRQNVTINGQTVSVIAASGYAFNTTDGNDRNNQLNAAKVIDTAISPKPYLDDWETTSIDAINGADQVTSAALNATHNAAYQNIGFMNGLGLIAKLIGSTDPNLGTRVFYISTGGFDTHANQSTDHVTLLTRVSDGLKIFYDDLVARNVADKVIVLVWSEFGRRVADNASFGTDHGTSNNMFVLGSRVKGGVYGPDPDLTNLQNGNLRWAVDFRSVYAEIIAKWLGGNPVDVLEGSFPQLGFL
jgi:uncharacterized protein (DUF1501 family)